MVLENVTPGRRAESMFNDGHGRQVSRESHVLNQVPVAHRVILRNGHGALDVALYLVERSGYVGVDARSKLFKALGGATGELRGPWNLTVQI